MLISVIQNTNREVRVNRIESIIDRSACTQSTDVCVCVRVCVRVCVCVIVCVCDCVCVGIREYESRMNIESIIDRSACTQSINECMCACVCVCVRVCVRERERERVCERETERECKCDACTHYIYDRCTKNLYSIMDYSVVCITIHNPILVY